MKITHLIKRRAPLLVVAITILTIGAAPLASALSISSITANSGPTNGGNQITIRGKGFLQHAITTDEIIQVVGATGTDSENDNSYTPDSVVALTKFDKVYTWGNNRYGNIGVNVSCMLPRDLDVSTSEKQSSRGCYYDKPQDITNKFDGRVTKIYQFNIDNDASIDAAITDNGLLYVWGQYAGLFNDDYDAEYEQPVNYTQPTLVSELSDYKVRGLTVVGSGSTPAITGFTDQGILLKLPELARINDEPSIEDFNWLHIDLAQQLGVKTIKSIDYINGLILTSDGELFMVDDQTEESSLIDTMSVADVDAPNSAQLVNVTSKIGEKLVSVEESSALAISESGQLYIINQNNDDLVATNISQIVQLPAVDSVVGYANSGYDVLVHTTNNRIYCIAMTQPSDIDYNDMQAYDITDYLSTNDIRLFNGHMNISRYVSFTDYYSYVDVSQPDTIYSRASLLYSRTNNMPATSEAKLSLDTQVATTPAVSAISFGNVLTTDFTIVDDQTILVTVPANTAGAVDVTLYDANGATIATADKGYTYIANDSSSGIGAPTSGIGGFVASHPAQIIAVGLTLAGCLLYITRRHTNNN